MPSKLMKRTLSGIVLSAVSFYVVYTGGLLFVAYVSFFAFVALYEWAQLSFKTARRKYNLFFGLLYIALTFGCCVALRMYYPVQYIIAFFFMVAFSDMGAYLFGKVIGGAKMAQTLSPKKTWAGFCGALFSGALIGFIFALFNFNYQLMPVLYFVFVGLLLGFVGQAGDLIVSSLKRKAGAKDTGNIIPGHGGVLDRVDAMMLATPVYLGLMKGMLYVVN